MLKFLRLTAASSFALLVLIAGCSTQQPQAASPSASFQDEKPTTPTPLTPSSNTSPTTTEVPKSDTNIQQIKRGEQIFRDMQSQSPAVMQVRGGANDDATATLIIPKTLWDGLSKKDQVSLTFYVESLIPDIRANPKKYTDTPPAAPAYNLMLNNIGKICDGCWDIMVGRVTSDRNMTLDETVVQGDEGWKRDEFKFGVKASEFRKDLVSSVATGTPMPAPSSVASSPDTQPSPESVSSPDTQPSPESVSSPDDDYTISKDPNGCLVVSGLREGTLRKMGMSLEEFKDSIKNKTGAQCVLFQ